MLELQSVEKRLGTFSVSDLNVEVKESEYFVLLGPSGVGKTVMLELIAGLMKPDKGRILWNGQDITRRPPEARGFAVVYQDYALFPHMTVADNIAYGIRSADNQLRFKVMAENVGIQHLMDRYPAKLSGGEQQRVSLARALLTDPQLMLLDEPLSALDLKTRRELRRELKRIHRETGTTFLHVTHDTEEAMSLGSRIGVMLDGVVRQVGTSEELFRSPSDSDVAEFLGMRNVIPVSDIGEGMCRANGARIHAASIDSSVSHIWIKPEEIVLSKEPFDSSARNQFKCTVKSWDYSGSLLVIHVAYGDLTLGALITYDSFRELGIEIGAELYATFKSSAVHCF